MIRVRVRIKVTEPSKNAASVCLLWKYGGGKTAVVGLRGLFVQPHPLP